MASIIKHRPLKATLLALLICSSGAWAEQPRRINTSITNIKEIPQADASPLSAAQTYTTPQPPEAATTGATPPGGSTPPDPFITDGSIGHFTWGVDLTSGVDLTANDMTMIAISGCFGYKGGIWRIAGVGAEIISMMNNSSRCYPVYAIARTSFTRRPSSCFMEMKACVAFNYMYNYSLQTDLYGSLGVGFTLAHSRRFSSHAVLSAVAMPLKEAPTHREPALGYTLVYASISLGCAF